jgi:hypothetical protein
MPLIFTGHRNTNSTTYTPTRQHAWRGNSLFMARRRSTNNVTCMSTRHNGPQGKLVILAVLRGGDGGMWGVGLGCVLFRPEM